MAAVKTGPLVLCVPFNLRKKAEYIQLAPSYSHVYSSAYSVCMLSNIRT